MTINITAQDIRDGEPARHSRPGESLVPPQCPVTLALTRAIGPSASEGGDAMCVSIGEFIGIGRPYPTRKVSIPEPLADWMRRWDSGKKMGPASFDIPGL